MPLVSVVVPVQHGGSQLRSTLYSLAQQTLQDLEILVVDDGCDDGTRAIIAEFAGSDPRFKYLAGPRVGSAGAARNVGLDAACGDYLAFLDADDLFAPPLLKRLHQRAVRDDADIVLTKFRTVDVRTGETEVANWALRLGHFPERPPITPDQLGDHLFHAVNPAAWNKLFRADFVRGHGLRFQHLRRTNDVFFTYMALALAGRISWLDACLIDYRTGNPNSLQGSLDEDPLEFTQMLDALRAGLADAQLLPKLERAFANKALDVCLTQLRKVTSASSFARLHRACREELFSRYGLTGRADDYLLTNDYAAQARQVLELSTEELLFRRLARAETAAADAQADARQALREMQVRAVAAGAPRIPAPVAPEPATVTSDGPEVTVVIPVHNSAPYLQQCLDSVRRQTGVGLQVIFVDDGSTDTSGEVLARLAAEEPRITVITQPNGGASVARNTGLGAATGRYVCFLDSDDYWRLDGLSALVTRADAEQLDLLLFDAASFREAGVSETLWARYEHHYERDEFAGVHSGAELLARLREAGQYRPSPCLYLARRSLIERLGVRFYPGIVHEDNLFTFHLMLGAARAGHTRTQLYARRLRPGSVTTGTSRITSARSYLVTYLEMQRLAAGGQYEHRIARQIGGVIYSAFKGARNSFAKVRTDQPDRLAEVDPSPEAQAAVILLQRLRAEAQLGRPRTNPVAGSTPAAGGARLRAVARRVRSSARRVARAISRRVRGR